jgi:hypothetical protein
MARVIDDVTAGAPALDQLLADLGITLRARRTHGAHHDHCNWSDPHHPKPPVVHAGA